MGARPYDPSLGRFLAVDPIDGGSLNNYDYAGQDPINGYDLNGDMLCEECESSAGAPDNSRSLQGAGDPGEPPGEDPADRSIEDNGRSKRSIANSTLLGWWDNIAVFNGANAKTVEYELSVTASKTADWVESRTTSGIRWTNKGLGIQLRISDYHSDIRLYAQRLGPRQPVEYAKLRG